MAEDAGRAGNFGGKNTANFALKRSNETGTRRISVEFCVSYVTAALKNLREEQGINRAYQGLQFPVSGTALSVTHSITC
jgi:hypothetical protein